MGNKTRKSALTTASQHFNGGASQCSKVRKKKKEKAHRLERRNGNYIFR